MLATKKPKTKHTHTHTQISPIWKFFFHLTKFWPQVRIHCKDLVKF